MNDDRSFFEELANKKEGEDPVPPLEGEAAFAKSSAQELRTRELDEMANDDEGQLTIDVYQTADMVIVESPIAGVEEKDLDIDITSDTVTIRGKRERERRIREEDYIYQECYWGKFSRSVVLPTEVDADRAEATIKNGVLTVKLPKLNRLKAKKLRVQKGE